MKCESKTHSWCSLNQLDEAVTWSGSQNGLRDFYRYRTCSCLIFLALLSNSLQSSAGFKSGDCGGLVFGCSSSSSSYSQKLCYELSVLMVLLKAHQIAVTDLHTITSPLHWSLHRGNFVVFLPFYQNYQIFTHQTKVQNSTALKSTPCVS